MPQTIYYDNENTQTSNQNIGGIPDLNITGNGTINVSLDKVIINNVTYNLNDMSSYMTRCNQLKDALSPRNLTFIQKQVDDLSSTIKLVQASDMASQVGSQIAVIQGAVDALTNNIQIMTTLSNDLQMIQGLQSNLSIGNNNLDGLNKPYQPSDDSVMQAQKTLENIQNGLQTISQSGLTGSLYDQAKAVQNAMNNLREALQQVQTSQQGINYEELIPASTINL
jgi:hypothetical protein